jgi:hypothetical protein
MPRSSESIANLAAALAKAQAELINPEKSLVATTRENGSGRIERSTKRAAAEGADRLARGNGRADVAPSPCSAPSCHALPHSPGLGCREEGLEHFQG